MQSLTMLTMMMVVVFANFECFTTFEFCHLFSPCDSYFLCFIISVAHVRFALKWLLLLQWGRTLFYYSITTAIQPHVFIITANTKRTNKKKYLVETEFHTQFVEFIKTSISADYLWENKFNGIFNLIGITLER